MAAPLLSPKDTAEGEGEVDPVKSIIAQIIVYSQFSYRPTLGTFRDVTFNLIPEE